MYYCLVNAGKMTVFANEDDRKLAVTRLPPETRAMGGLSPDVGLCLEVEIDVLDKLFRQERMFALVAAAKALKAQDKRDVAAHYLKCARAERGKFA